MPANLEIGFFVFGAVLILIGLVGGHFKIFISNIPGVANPFLRFVAFILGIAFVLLAIYPGMISVALAESTNTTLPTKTENPQPIPQPAETDLQPTQTSLPPTPIYETPVPQKPSPTEFIVTYWQNVSDGKFEISWTQLSPRFQHAMHHDNYSDYVRGLQETQLCQILASNSALVKQNDSSAIVTVHLVFYTGAQCNSNEYDFETWLLYNAAANSWLLDKNTIR